MVYFVTTSKALFEAPSVQYCTIEDVVTYCSSKKFLGVDTETEGLHFMTDKMVMLQIGNGENQYVIDTRYIDISPLRGILSDPSIVKIFQNVKFDYKFIRKWGNITLQNVYDTMLAEQVLHNGKINYGFSLQAQCERYLGIYLNKPVRKEFTSLTVRGMPFTETQVKYGAMDIEHLCSVYELQKEASSHRKLEEVIDLENQAALAFADIEYTGIPLNASKWSILSEEALKSARTLEERLDCEILSDTIFKDFVSPYIQGDLFIPREEIRTVNVNWSSPTQVLKVFKTILPTLENVNGKELLEHKKAFSIIDTYIEYKEKMKLATSYGEEFLSHLNTDGRIRTRFKQILNTGRVASSSPNMQQIPADNRYRNCFEAPEGMVFVSADYSSQELCIIAEGSKDPVWIEALKKGQDLHSVCAELVYGDIWLKAAEKECAYYSAENSGEGLITKQKCDCPKHKKLRTNVKTVNFGLAYGMGPSKLAATINVPQKEAEELIIEYFKTFPSIKRFLESLGNYGKVYGRIYTFAPFRRIRWFPQWFQGIQRRRDLSDVLGTIERASKNTPIQGTGADMTKLALVLIREYLNKYPEYGIEVVMTVHDQIDTLCPLEHSDKWKLKMAELMEEAAVKILPSGLLKAEATVTPIWSK